MELLLTHNTIFIMKRYFLILLIFFVGRQGFGQVINDSGNHSLMLLTTKENARMNSVEGSPYLHEEFRYGTATIQGKEPLKVFMRYNVDQEQIEIKTDIKSEDIYVLPKDEKTLYEIGPEALVFDQISHNGKRIFGYFIEHFKGKNLRLLEKPVASLTEAVKAKTGYDRDRPAKIVIEEEFYVVNMNGKVKNVRLKHRDIKKTFNSPFAKKYLSNNKIRSEEDLISFVVYLDANKD
jgi:hypothetical protein